VAHFAPRAVVQDFAAGDADDAEHTREVPERVGKREVRAVAVPDEQPALDAVGLADRFRIIEKGVDVVAAIPVGATAAARLEAHDLAAVVKSVRVCGSLA
jgi:hypothetical protein